MTFQIHELYVSNNLRIVEYTTRFNQRRFDIQPWKGERELRIPIEVTPGVYEVKSYPIELFLNKETKHWNEIEQYNPSIRNLLK